MKKITMILRNSYLHLALRLFLGATFIASAVAKLPMQERFIDVVKDYHMLPNFLASFYGSVLPWLELLLGVYILLGMMIKQSSFTIILIAATFMVANIGAIAKGMEHCGTCFGEAFPLSAPAALALDFIVIIAAVVLLVHGHRARKLSVDGYFENRTVKVEAQPDSSGGN
jgi:uncharacterized membrane protein YphA (DoxX/SURF4 family)